MAGVGEAVLGEYVWKALHGLYSEVEFYIFIFSLRDSNWIMKCSFK